MQKFCDATEGVKRLPKISRSVFVYVIICQRLEKVNREDLKMEATMMSQAAREKRREYARAWRAKNPGKNSEYCKRYWERKAQAEKAVECGEMRSV